MFCTGMMMYGVTMGFVLVIDEVSRLWIWVYGLCGTVWVASD